MTPVREVEATEVASLGISFSAMPPKRVMVKTVQGCSWAEQQNLRSGDVVVAVNGRTVEDMKQGEFVAAIRSRPLTLSVEARNGEHDVQSYSSECGSEVSTSIGSETWSKHPTDLKDYTPTAKVKEGDKEEEEEESRFSSVSKFIMWILCRQNKN